MSFEVVTQAAGQPLPVRPVADVVFWISWDEPPVSSSHPHDQWFEIAQIVEATEPSAPVAPASLTATAGDSQVALSWPGSVSTGDSAAAGYRVYRHTADTFASATQLGADLGSAARSYTDTTAVNGTQYYYWVTAFNALGESAASPSANATPSVSAYNPLTAVTWHSAWFPEPGQQADGTAVSSVSDRTAAARNLTQATAGSRPTFVEAHASFNGKAVISYDGVDDYLSASAWADANPSIFVGVLQVAADGTDQVFLWSQDGTGNGLPLSALAMVAGATNNYRVFAGTTLDTTIAAGSPQIVIIRLDGANSFVRVNGVQVSGDAGARTLAESLVFGRRDYEADRYAQMDQGFSGVTTALTTQQIADFEAWAASYYGITLP